MNPKNRELTIDFSNFRAGLNTKDPHISIGEKQAYSGTENIVFKESGIAPWFSFAGIKDSAVFPGKITGLDIYSRVDGTDILIAGYNGSIYSINKSTGVGTLIYTLGGLGEFWFVSFYDKLFAANGTGSCVIEGSAGYQIGITPPSGVSVAATAGGSLANGDYTIYASYARMVSGVAVLYSQGEELGTVTLGSGNNTIAVSDFANSSDTRVGNKIIWAQGPNDAGVFLYHATGDNTTTSFNITDTTLYDATKYYRTLSNPSAQPPVMTGIFAHDDRIFGWYENTLYASMQAVTVYDLERWPDIQYKFPFRITGLFAIGEDLFINTDGRGIIKLPEANMDGAYKQVTKKRCFKFIRSVENIDENSKESPSPVIGITQNGVRIFDGYSFTIDLTKSIKNDMDDLYSGASSEHAPVGFVQRANDRTEYRFSYRDLDIGSVCNNYTYVLNLDQLVINSNVDYTAPWESVKVGFNYACVDGSDEAFMAQSLESGSQIFKDDPKHTIDRNIFKYNGTFVSSASKACNLVTKMVIPSIAGRFRLEQLRYISYMRSSATITIYIGEEISINEENTVETGGRPLFGVARFGVDRFSSNEPIIGVHKLGRDIKGVAVYVVVNFNSKSINDYLSEMKLFGEYLEGSYK